MIKLEILKTIAQPFALIIFLSIIPLFLSFPIIQVLKLSILWIILIIGGIYLFSFQSFQLLYQLFLQKLYPIFPSYIACELIHPNLLSRIFFRPLLLNNLHLRCIFILPVQLARILNILS